MASLDDLHCELHDLLQSATHESLLKVCAEVGIDGEGKSTKALLRLIRRYTSSDAVEEQEDEGYSVVEKLLSMLKIPPCPEPSATTSQHSPSAAPTVSPPDLPTGTMFRREFRVFGQIGDVTQKDRISFLSLMHQIESGLAKGYGEREVVEAVVRAINPASRLCSYLGGKSALILTDLRRVLRSHYKESGATDLYYQLSRARQEAKESPQEFLIRAMDLQQKVLFVSKEATTGPRYEVEQVRAMFLHTLQTGFRSEGVRMEMRSHLQNPEVSDEELLEHLNTAASQEEERQRKMGTVKPTAVNSITEQTPAQAPTKVPTPNPLMEDLKELRAQVASIAETLQSGGRGRNQQGTRMSRPRGPPRRWGCKHCQSQGVGDQCQHCFKCGASDHFMRDCRRPSGNDQGLPQRGEQ